MQPLLLSVHQARFSRHVFPGERLRVSMWRIESRVEDRRRSNCGDGSAGSARSQASSTAVSTVLFQTEVIDRPGGAVTVLSGAAVEFHIPLAAAKGTRTTLGSDEPNLRSRSKL